MTLLLLVLALAIPSSTVGQGTSVRAGAVEPLRRGDLSLAGPFSEERAPFALRLAGRNRLIAYRVAFTTVLPGEVLELAPASGRAGFTLRAGAGRVLAETAAGWRWEAPAEPGSYALRVEDSEGRAVHVNVFVLVPSSAIRSAALNGYRIGAYRVTAGRPHPRGFIEAHRADEDILVSPHFTLGQFLSKQPGSPKYAIVSVPLVMKLEAVLARVVAAGHDVRTLHVMSAFRTPWYNRSIGNTTTLSYHLYGEAADIFVDADRNGYMDDLNGDGVRDVADARVLFGMVEQVERAERSRLPGILVGGLKAYRKNQVRGPFVHVDVRGRAARW
ncbi:MAG: D-Ala-D-Ala carboxypeptidase family metallohydrolase [Longimicrobiales bacterium]|nr:D-Ala-D-Ala carboxypeptidase family metallohydrolase [Longimicrobiales bacterium]